MPKKNIFDGVIVTRTTDADGYVYASDKNGRSCWDNENPERVVLIEDLRRYAPGLHKGQLGWTVPGSTDGYKWVDVQFDNGPCIPVLTYGLQRVSPEKAQAISQAIIESCRGTRFDADVAVAEAKREEWIREVYSTCINSDDLVTMGDGPEEVYAYTYPSLMELAKLKGESLYPVKIGYTADSDCGAFSRISSQMFERAPYPEKCKLLVILRCRAGRTVEAKVHRHLRMADRRLQSAIGREWFLSNAEELHKLFRSFAKETSDHTLEITGADKDATFDSGSESSSQVPENFGVKGFLTSCYIPNTDLLDDHRNHPQLPDKNNQILWWKAMRDRFGSELDYRSHLCSPRNLDIVTWTVFRTLEQAKKWKRTAEYLGMTEADCLEVLYWLFHSEKMQSHVQTTFWELLRAVDGRQGGQFAMPDIILISKSEVCFIEPKLSEQWKIPTSWYDCQGLPFEVYEKFLADKGVCLFIRDLSDGEAQEFYQLIWNVFYAWALGDQLGRKPLVVCLVNEHNHIASGTGSFQEWFDRFRALLRNDGAFPRSNLLLKTWQGLAQTLRHGEEEEKSLAEYLLTHQCLTQDLAMRFLSTGY